MSPWSVTSFPLAILAHDAQAPRQVERHAALVCFTHLPLPLGQGLVPPDPGTQSDLRDRE